MALTGKILVRKNAVHNGLQLYVGLEEFSSGKYIWATYYCNKDRSMYTPPVLTKNVVVLL